jgi:DNA-binding response OmpR family regulator
MRILVVEDDPKIAQILLKGLEQASYSVVVASNGEEGLALAQAGDFDSIVLDMMLPGKSGLQIVQELRLRGSGVPILALTARSALAERIDGLNSGCDDYLAKPFSFDELLARLRALLRRPGPISHDRLEYAGLTLDPVTRVVTRDGKGIELTLKEFGLLELLMRRPGHIVTGDAIIERLWGDDALIGRNVLEVYIHHLRRKVDPNPAKRLLHTVRGVGYVLREEVR